MSKCVLRYVEYNLNSTLKFMILDVYFIEERMKYHLWMTQIQKLVTKKKRERTKLYLSLSFSKILFIYFWLCWVFVAAWAFLRLWWAELLSSCGMQVSHCRLPLLRRTGSRAWALAVARELGSCGSWALQHRVNSCGAQA